MLRYAEELLGRLLVTERCCACEREITDGTAFCEACVATIEEAPGAHLPFPIAAVGAFGGALGTAITSFKFSDRPDLARPLGELVASAVADPARFDLVVPVPLARIRLQDRGYNQAALISARIAARHRIAHSPSALERPRETAQQARLGRANRKENLEGAFVAKDVVRGRRVLLVDDVTTTGATLRAAALAVAARGGLVAGAAVIAITRRETPSAPEREELLDDLGEARPADAFGDETRRDRKA